MTKATSKTRLESGGSSGLAATLRQLPTARAERRARRRLPLALPARITFESGPERETRTVAGLSSNLSSLGAYLISPETLASGQVVFLAFDAPPELCGTPAIKIQCQGEVLRTDRRTDGRQGVAVRFLRARIHKHSSPDGRPRSRRSSLTVMM